MRKFVNSSIRKFNWQPAGYTGEKEKVEGRKNRGYRVASR
jgi:hypothetical protein